MMIHKLKSIAVAILIASGVSVGGVGVWAYQESKSSSPTDRIEEPEQKEAIFEKEVRGSRPAQISPQAPGQGGRMRGPEDMVGVTASGGMGGRSWGTSIP